MAETRVSRMAATTGESRETLMMALRAAIGCTVARLAITATELAKAASLKRTNEWELPLEGDPRERPGDGDEPFTGAFEVLTRRVRGHLLI